MTLQQLRVSKNVKAREVARRMKSSHPIVLRFEKLGVANLETAEKYAAALNVEFIDVHRASLETRRQAASSRPAPVKN